MSPVTVFNCTDSSSCVRGTGAGAHVIEALPPGNRRTLTPRPVLRIEAMPHKCVATRRPVRLYLNSSEDLVAVRIARWSSLPALFPNDIGVPKRLSQRGDPGSGIRTRSGILLRFQRT